MAPGNARGAAMGGPAQGGRPGCRENERLRMEHDFLKESAAMFSWTSGMSFRFIKDHRDALSNDAPYWLAR